MILCVSVVSVVTCFISFFFLSIYLFIFGCAGSLLLCRLSSHCIEWGQSPVEVRGLLIEVASLIVEHSLQGTKASVVVAHGLNSCSFWALEHRLYSCGATKHIAQLLHGMWDLSWFMACRVFPDQELNSRLLNWQADYLTLSHHESPLLFLILFIWALYLFFLIRMAKDLSILSFQTTSSQFHSSFLFILVLI